MKGIVFTELLDLVDATFGAETTEAVLDDAAPPSGGAYTAVGTYPAAEAVALLGALERRTGVPAAQLLRAFGKHLMKRFTQLFPQFFVQAHSALEFIGKVENYIHIEVRKLYPDAELPSFEYRDGVADTLCFVYRSARAMGDLAEGLIEGCAEHYGETLRVERQDLSGGKGIEVLFRVTVVRSPVPA